MSADPPFLAASHIQCRLIVCPPSPGPWNMAVDEALLIDAAENGTATLRLYQWSEPTLSLGYFQSYRDRQHHAASRQAAIVRRQTGGGAILHDRELTYSLALPASHSLARQAEQLYTAVHEAFIDVLTPLIAAVNPGWKLELRAEDSQLSQDDEPFLCFQRRARGDLLLFRRGEPSQKILGSAQRRRRGAILQHGSLLLQKSAAAPELTGLCDLTAADVTADGLAAALPARLGTILEIRREESQLPEDLRSTIEEFASRKYAAASWTNRR